MKVVWTMLARLIGPYQQSPWFDKPSDTDMYSFNNPGNTAQWCYRSVCFLNMYYLTISRGNKQPLKMTSMEKVAFSSKICQCVLKWAWLSWCFKALSLTLFSWTSNIACVLLIYNDLLALSQFLLQVLKFPFYHSFKSLSCRGCPTHRWRSFVGQSW